MTDCVTQAQGEGWAIYNGDCVGVLEGIPDESIGYSIYSLPFAGLFVYSNNECDMGNCKDDDEFFQHYGFLVDQLIRVIKPGRLVSVHCMNLPSTKQNDGVIGIRDFRGDIIRAHCGGEAADIAQAMYHIENRLDDALAEGDYVRSVHLKSVLFSLRDDLKRCPPKKGGFIYHSEVTIWKDPVTAMQRTKAIGLLHKQLVKDSAMSRQGIADYILNFVKPTYDGEFTTTNGPRDVTSLLLELFQSVSPSNIVTFRKPGTNAEPIHGRLETFAGDQSTFQHRGDLSIDIWQRYASPVWMDIDQTDTLNNYRAARETSDERHLAPLQLGVIERCLQLWSMPGDTILSPYAGIASELYQAILMGRNAIGTELKGSYFEIGKVNCERAEKERKASLLF